MIVTKTSQKTALITTKPDMSIKKNIDIFHNKKSDSSLNVVLTREWWEPVFAALPVAVPSRLITSLLPHISGALDKVYGNGQFGKIISTINKTRFFGRVVQKTFPSTSQIVKKLQEFLIDRRGKISQKNTFLFFRQDSWLG